MQKRILVVDDDEGVRQLLTDRLQAMGFVVVTAADGRAGLEAIRSSWIDGVFLDCEMPVMHGLEMLRELRAWYPRIFVFMMSGNPDPEKVDRALTLGAKGFFLKPFDFRRLEEQCRRLFE